MENSQVRLLTNKIKMTQEEIIQEIVDKDLEIERAFRQIEEIYKEIKQTMVEKNYWVKKLQNND